MSRTWSILPHHVFFLRIINININSLVFSSISSNPAGSSNVVGYFSNPARHALTLKPNLTYNNMKIEKLLWKSVKDPDLCFLPMRQKIFILVRIMRFLILMFIFVLPGKLFENLLFLLRINTFFHWVNILWRNPVYRSWSSNTPTPIFYFFSMLILG